VQPVKLALLELVTRRIVDAARVAKAGRPGTVNVLSLGARTTKNGVLQYVLNWLSNCRESAYPDGTKGVEVEALSLPGSQFVEGVVMESLTRKGLFVSEKRSYLRFFSTSQQVLTRIVHVS
jgi:hypothetical protein